jgi:hypothetical protein
VKVGFFRPLYSHLGDYVSVYLDTLRVHDDADDEVGRRWRAARQRLTGAGAPARTLDAIEAVVTDPARAAPGRALFARDGRVTFTAPLGAAPRREIARLGQLPHLMPLLVQRPPPEPHRRVAASRPGGDIALRGAGETVLDRRSPRRWPGHKGAGRGWPQARRPRGAGEAREENAKALAAGLAESASSTRAERSVMTGEAKARSLPFDHLPIPLRSRATEVEREARADPAAGGAAGRSITARAARECRARFGEWQARRAHHGTVEGLAATLTALREGRVADLFIADRPASAATVWIGPDGADVAISQSELHEHGVPDPLPERADAAIVRALAATDAELHFLPEDLVVTGGRGAAGGIRFPRGGICATLRWAEVR